MPNYYLTTVKIQVLSELPVNTEDLDDLHYEITHGDYVGGPLTTQQKVISTKQVIKKLREFGSEPSFFGLNDDGSPWGE